MRAFRGVSALRSLLSSRHQHSKLIVQTCFSIRLLAMAIACHPELLCVPHPTRAPTTVGNIREASEHLRNRVQRLSQFHQRSLSAGPWLARSSCSRVGSQSCFEQRTSSMHLLLMAFCFARWKDCSSQDVFLEKRWFLPQHYFLCSDPSPSFTRVARCR